MISQVTICHRTKRHYIIIDYILHTVHIILVTHLFCNLKFEPLYSTYFSPPPNSLPSSNLLFILCIYDSLSVLCLLIVLFF